MNEELPAPLKVSGVVLFVDEDAKYGYLYATHYGRVLIRKYYQSDTVKLGAWLSLFVLKNSDPVLTFDYTQCQFSDVSEPQPIEMMLPSGVTVPKTGVEQVRLQAAVYVGSILSRGGVGLNSLFGRVYFSEMVIKKFSIKSLNWVKVSMVSVNPCAENFSCQWEARVVKTTVTNQEKEGICKYKAVYFTLIKEDFCLLRLVGCGCFAFAYATDFADAIDQKLLLNSEFEVIACKPLCTYNRVPICYATLIGGEHHSALQKVNLDIDIELRSESPKTEVFPKASSDKTPLCNNSTSEDYGAMPSRGVQPKTSSDLGVCNLKCETISVILEIMKDEKFVEICKEENQDLYMDLRAFVKQCDL